MSKRYRLQGPRLLPDEVMPDWCRWSDGRELSNDDKKKLRFVRKRSQQPGESFKAWFMRTRGAIERYEGAKAAIKPPTRWQRFKAWWRGRVAVGSLRRARG